METEYFLCGPYRYEVTCKFSTGIGEEMSSTLEAEEFPLLEVVPRERLVKTAGWKKA
jgi:hypothetical protein